MIMGMRTMMVMMVQGSYLGEAAGPLHPSLVSASSCLAWAGQHLGGGGDHDGREGDGEDEQDIYAIPSDVTEPPRLMMLFSLSLFGSIRK